MSTIEGDLIVEANAEDESDFGSGNLVVHGKVQVDTIEALTSGQPVNVAGIDVQDGYLQLSTQTNAP